MKTVSLRKAISLPVLGVLVVGIALLVAIVGARTASATQDLTQLYMEETVSRYAADLQGSGQSALYTANALAPAVRSLRALPDARDQVVAVLLEALEGNESLLAVWTAWEPNAFDGPDSAHAGRDYHDDAGRFVPYVYRTATGLRVESLIDYDDPVEGEYYQAPLGSGDTYITDPYYYMSDTGELLVYSIGIPILENGRAVGVVGVDVSIADLSRHMASVSLLGEGYLLTVNHNGTVVTHPDPAMILQPLSGTWMGRYADDVASMLQAGEISSTRARDDNLGSYVQVEFERVSMGGEHWAVIGVVPESAFTRSATRLVTLIVAIGVILIAVIAAMIVLIVRRNLRDLPVLTGAAQAISTGSIEVNLGHSDNRQTKNEVELLKQAFSDMVENIAAQVHAVQRVARGDLTTDIRPRSGQDVLGLALQEMVRTNRGIVQNIQDAAESVNQGARQISQSAQLLAQVTVEQSASVDELTAGVQNIQQKTLENQKLAGEAAALSGGVVDIARRGADKMQEMTTAVGEISESSRKIEKVIKMIDDIAFQTNILSLNAAVEAARAGQHGKGFAVVADEVRNLALKSAEAAGETAAMIAESMAKAGLGERIAAETSELLAEIVENILQSTELVEKIPLSTQAQTKAIEEIRTGFEQVSATTQQNSTTAEQSASTSEQLTGQSERLRALTEHFRLSALPQSAATPQPPAPSNPANPAEPLDPADGMWYDDAAPPMDKYG